jgi:hypothetical protein
VPGNGKLRKLAALVLTVTAILTLAACGASFDYDKDAAVRKAKEVVDAVNKRDYEAVFDMMNGEMQEVLPASELKKNMDPVLDDSGAFSEYASVKTAGVTQKGVDYIVVVVSAKYENAARVYTISLTAGDMLLGGLYVR